MERLAQDDQLRAYVHHGFWQPMDTLRDKQLPRGVVGDRHGSVEKVGDRSAGVLARAARLSDRPHGLQRRLDGCLLRHLGAEVHGYALAPRRPTSLFDAASLADDMDHTIGDVRDPAALRAALDARADRTVVIHMAAQALVRRSYAEPVETYATNVMGTVHLLEAVRTCHRSRRS